LRWKLVAELHGQSSCRLDPSLCVFRIDGIVRDRPGRLNVVAKLSQAFADSSLQVGEFLLLWVPIKD
jgi:hypothetical protein